MEQLYFKNIYLICITEICIISLLVLYIMIVIYKRNMCKKSIYELYQKQINRKKNGIKIIEKTHKKEKKIFIKNINSLGFYESIKTINIITLSCLLISLIVNFYYMIFRKNIIISLLYNIKFKFIDVIINDTGLMKYYFISYHLIVIFNFIIINLFSYYKYCIKYNKEKNVYYFKEFFKNKN